LASVLGHAQESKTSLKDQIVAQERAELDALKTGDMKALSDFVANDAVFVDASGSAGKAEVVQHTQGFRLHDYSMSDIKFVGLSKNSGLIVYQIAESGTAHGKEFSAKVNVSALWVKRSGKWVCVFSQETAAK
jgi:ketosteroid isomerase-like protein